jgi:hypothetical protein
MVFGACEELPGEALTSQGFVGSECLIVWAVLGN